MLVGVHLLVSLRHLDVVPVAHPDEPLLASAASTVAEEGRLAAPFREGLAGSEDHLYAWLPVHPLLLAGWFRLVGVGLFETRVFSVLASAGVLVLTFLLGRRLAGGSVGLLAVVLVVATRILWEGPVTPTGITLLDVSRVGRYDPLVALFGLATVLAYMAGRDAPTPGRGWFVLTGVAAMLSALSNAYGLAFLAGVVLVSVADGTWRRAVPWLAVGAAGPAVAYLVHALQDPAGWQAQMELAVRGDLRPWDLLGNLVAERHRYAPGLGAFGWRWLARPGFWAAMIAVPSAVVWLLSRARRG
ncbi:MAG: hypothetical protein R3320_01860, partial [Nitriliruptorales bacterium]|nr:hypothetical protein [Nitriliruptorales bacterium]